LQGEIAGEIGEIEKVTAKPGEVIEEKDSLNQKGNILRISPMVRKIAEELEVDIGTLKGSGPNGLITKEDVLNAARFAVNKIEEKTEELKEELKGEQEVVPFTRTALAVAKKWS
jgi:pyruvate/2-oxoglutarate dehydrogenase complex dihydrolipoamide acyltransferase (E2) component